MDETLMLGFRDEELRDFSDVYFDTNKIGGNPVCYVYRGFILFCCTNEIRFYIDMDKN